MKTREKRMLILLLVVIVLLAVWVWVFDKYPKVEELPPTDLSTPRVEEPIKINNVIKTTVSVVEPDEAPVE